MSDDLISNLEDYKVQLQQVEAALLAEPDNEELLKLKQDLNEVVAITEELAHDDPAFSNAAAGSSTDPAASAAAAIQWKIGDECMAPSSKNNQYYEAVVDGISEGKVAVTFSNRNITDVCRLTQLKPVEKGVTTTKKNYLWETKASSKKLEWAAEKERRRKKAQKKAQRYKQMEESKEQEKIKWKQFQGKAIHKSLKGINKGSSLLNSKEKTFVTGVLPKPIKFHNDPGRGFRDFAR